MLGDDVKLVMSAMYESVFPVEPTAQPLRHHLVVYFSVELESVPSLLVCDDKELDRYAFLSSAQIERVLNRTCTREESFVAHTLSGQLEVASLYNLQGLPDPDTGEYKQDRLSTGSQLVLQELLNKMKTRCCL